VWFRGEKYYSAKLFSAFSLAIVAYENIKNPSLLMRHRSLLRKLPKFTKKKLTKRECRKESFARCDGRPKAPPLETASFWKSSTKTTHKTRHVVSETSLMEQTGEGAPVPRGW